MAEAFPRIKCTVLDLPHVVTSCQGSENLNFVAGDMFQSIPSADVVLIKGVLYDWSDEECVKILKRCREAISSKEEGGKVIIVDMVIDMKESTHESTKIQLMFDMEMMVEVTGKERTRHEWEKLFIEAGFITYKILCLGIELKDFVLDALLEFHPLNPRSRQVHAKFQGCPYILRCYGDDNGRIIYNVLFEHASGGNLADLIKTSGGGGGGGGLAESDVKSFTKSILLGLDHIHKKGYAHLDIKPKNILLVPDLTKKRKRKRGASASSSAGFDAKIADFWIAKSSKQILAELQWEDRGPACDIWALGCVVVEMLCGQPAFSIKPGESLGDFLDRIGLGGESPRIPVGISREAQDFLKRCFVRNSKSRWNASRLLSHPFLKDHIPDAESPKKLSFVAIKPKLLENPEPRVLGADELLFEEDPWWENMGGGGSTLPMEVATQPSPWLPVGLPQLVVTSTPPLTIPILFSDTEKSTLNSRVALTFSGAMETKSTAPPRITVGSSTMSYSNTLPGGNLADLIKTSRGGAGGLP
ncbi:hypothetical protein Scep_011507 [Stephania cephalantha]|uniref:Protein kinase domain-containing protein n=1 Tax=Stephania cephalantha TaxID=152367 RepID=A0AAP0P6J5_9MAGN